MAPAADPRFARLQTDPRFRRAKQKSLKVELDDRFRDVLESEEFGGKGKGKGKGKADQGGVDKRGRPLATGHHADQLKRFYRLRSPEAAGETSQEGFVDYARGEGVLDSSGSEDEGGSDEAESEVEEKELELGGKQKRRLPGYESETDSDESGSEGSHLEVDLSENEEEFAQFDDGEDEGSDEEDAGPGAEPTKRIAAVNLDWDNLRATDLFAVFNSFLRSGETSTLAGLGKLVNVRIYPSEFGKGRMEKEEQEGPGGGIFITKAGEERGKNKRTDRVVRQQDLSEDEEDSGDGDEGQGDSDDEGDLDPEDDEDEEEDVEGGEYLSSSGEEYDLPRTSGVGEEIDGLEIISDVGSDAGSEDIDMDKLRQYQLERLRYYYAIATFSSVAAAEKVMTDCNGTEFERTANMMDLSYVPEDMEFAEDDLHDEATKESKGYKGNDFVTDALRHSKVKLTWDQDDPNRIKLTRRTLTRDEIEEEDFKNLVASSGSEDEELRPSSKSKSKKGSKEKTNRLRALLLAANDDDGDVWGKAGTSYADVMAESEKPGKEGDMEITFRPALSEGVTGKVADEENLTTLERYQLRVKERKARKKEKIELSRAGKESDDEVDGEDGKSNEKGKGKGKVTAVKKDDFFAGEDDSDSEEEKVVVKPVVKEDARKVPEQQEEAVDGVEHFSMKDIVKAEKEKGKRRRRQTKGKKGAHDDERETELGPDGWKIDVKDERFKVLHEEPEFAIDPSNPRFTKTKAMQDLLAERAKIRASKPPREPVGVRKTAQPLGNGNEKDLSSLIQSVKRKADLNQHKGRKRSKK